MIFRPYSEGQSPYLATYDGFSSQFTVDAETGHGRFDPIPPQEFLDKYYNGTFTRSDNPVTPESEFRPEIIEIMTGVKNYLSEIAGLHDRFTFHDVGCGFGAGVHAMQQIGIIATGNESNREWVRAANPFCDNCLSAEPLDEVLAALPYKVDVFFCSHVLEHLPDPLSTIKLMAQYMSTSGVVYLCVPNTHCLRAYLGGISDQAAYSFPMHLNYFTPKSMCAMLREAGLEPVQIETRPLFESIAGGPSAVESLFAADPDGLADADAWQKAACANLLGGELFILATHPRNTCVRRQPNLDKCVERAFLTFMKRWPVAAHPAPEVSSRQYPSIWQTVARISPIRRRASRQRHATGR